MNTSMNSQAVFRELQVPGEPLLMPNPWDAGSAKLLASIGFRALATTSSGGSGLSVRLLTLVDSRLT